MNPDGRNGRTDDAKTISLRLVGGIINTKYQSFDVHKVQNLRAEHSESYSNFSYCMYSSVYQVLWPSS